IVKSAGDHDATCQLDIDLDRVQAGSIVSPDPAADEGRVLWGYDVQRIFLDFAHAGDAIMAVLVRNCCLTPGVAASLNARPGHGSVSASLAYRAFDGPRRLNDMLQSWAGQSRYAPAVAVAVGDLEEFIDRLGIESFTRQDPKRARCNAGPFRFD